MTATPHTASVTAVFSSPEPDSHRSAGSQTPPYGYMIVALSLLIMVIAWGVNYSFGVFLTPLLDEFGWTRAMTSGAFSLAMLMEGLGGIFMGRLTDKVGPRVVMTTCGFLLGAGYALMSEVVSLWHLYLYYGLIAGFGLSGTYVSLISTVAKWFHKRRGSMIGIVMAGTGLGSLIVTPVANGLILSQGWRRSYLILGIIAVVVIVVTSQFLRKNPPGYNQATPNGVDDTSSSTNDDGRRFSGDIPYTAVFRLSSLWLLCGILFSWGFALFAVFVHLAPFCIELGFSATRAASVLAVAGGAIFVAKVLCGVVVDIFGVKKTMFSGLALTVATLLGLVVFQQPWTLYLCGIFYACSYSCASVVISPLAVAYFGLRSHGSFLGILNFATCIGCATGPVAAGWLFDLTGDYTDAFKVTLVICSVGVLLAIWLIRGKKRAVSTGLISA